MLTLKRASSFACLVSLRYSSAVGWGVGWGTSRPLRVVGGTYDIGEQLVGYRLSRRPMGVFGWGGWEEGVPQPPWVTARYILRPTS